MSQLGGFRFSCAGIASQTVFYVGDKDNVRVQVRLSDITPQCLQDASALAAEASHNLDMFGHHLFITGSIVSRDQELAFLDRFQMHLITKAMEENIKLLCKGWLNLSALRSQKCRDVLATDPRSPSLAICGQGRHREAVVVTLVPSKTIDKETCFRCFRVEINWSQRRQANVRDLDIQLREDPLTPLIGDLVQQLTSRLMVEALLSSPSSAELFHRSWQQRQREVEPLIGSIAMSMRSLISNASNSTQLQPLLQRLNLSPSLPSVIIIGNLLTQMDLAANLPDARPSTAAEQLSKQRLVASASQDIPLPGSDFDDDEAESGFEWPRFEVDVARQQIAVKKEAENLPTGIIPFQDDDDEFRQVCWEAPG